MTSRTTPMASASPGTADTLTMTLFHSALCRDLERTRLLLHEPRHLTTRRRRRVGRHLLWVINALRWHHEGEDHDLWPLLLERDPGCGTLLDQMQAEHDAIDEPLHRFEEAARGLVAGRTAPHEALTALTALEEPLRAHLAHEELDAMEVAGRVLSHEEWRSFEQRAWIEGYTVPESLRFLAWMSDGVAWEDSLRRRLGLPPVAVWAVVKPLSALARVPGLSVWAGTPAAHVGSRRVIA